MYDFRSMTLEYAKAIKDWRYNGYMKEIYMEPYFKSAEQGQVVLKGPGNCDGYVVLKGLAINPQHVGKGLSTDFIKNGINFTIQKYNYRKSYIQLTLEKDNLSAYKAYLKAGFDSVESDDSEIKMIYKIK